ncbi:MAG: hypothetical protein J6N52_08275 [Clostridia bacterium]|nr:hypothetical protein [Clostridia bacterium]
MKKALSITLAAVFAASLLAGCGGEKNISEVNVEDVYPWNAEGVDDSSDLPDWNGEKIEFTYWMGHGTNAEVYKAKSNDVVTPEVERVTGVSFNYDDRIDNSGQTFDAKLSMLLANDDFPDMVVAPENLSKLVEADVVYELTDYLKKYAPNVMNKYPEGVFNETTVNGGYDGKIYAIPTGVGGDYLSELEGFDLNRINQAPKESRGYVWVRDDILKMLYPNAKSQEEIEKIYMDKGEFSYEDIFDVPINSYDDFVKFLYDIKKLDVKEGNKTVAPIYGFTGTDNWSIMECLWGWLEGRNVGAGFNYMFGCWDKQKQQIVLPLKEDWFKDSLKIWNQMVIDDVVSKDSLIENNDVFKEKVNNGLYAVLTSFDTPDNDALKTSGKNFRYRKVYLNIPMNTEKFPAITEAQYGTQNSIAVFKDEVSEDELIMFLRYIDYMISDIGEKVQAWGPRSAGIWTEENGVRRFTNENIEKYVVYGEDNTEGESYNLTSVDYSKVMLNQNISPMIHFQFSNMSKFHPAYVYDKNRNVADANTAFSSGFVIPAEYKKCKIPAIWIYCNTVDSVKKAWGNRPNVEDALTRILASANDQEFNKNYSKLMETLQQGGWTDEMLSEYTAAYIEDNAEYMSALK